MQGSAEAAITQSLFLQSPVSGLWSNPTPGIVLAPHTAAAQKGIENLCCGFGLIHSAKTAKVPRKLCPQTCNLLRVFQGRISITSSIEFLINASFNSHLHIRKSVGKLDLYLGFCFSLYLLFFNCRTWISPYRHSWCPANGNPNGKTDVFHINIHRNGDFSLLHWILKKKDEDLNLSGVRERLVEGKLQIPFGSGVWGTFLQNKKSQ